MAQITNINLYIVATCNYYFLKVIWVYWKQVLLLLDFGYCTINVSIDVCLCIILKCERIMSRLNGNCCLHRIKCLTQSNKHFSLQAKIPSELFIGMWMLERFNRGVQIASIIVALNPFPKMMIVMLTLSVKDI